MDEESTPYLGFRQEIYGKIITLVFVVLPFGFSPAPRICKKLFKPLVLRWRRMKMLTILFDDGSIIGDSNKL